MSTDFNNWKYLITILVCTVCVCGSISYGLGNINTSVKEMTSGIRTGIDSVKGMQMERKVQAGGYYDSVKSQLDRIEKKVSK